METSDLKTHGASQEAIQHHYDVGNEFFEYWLGRTFTYSAALFEEGEGNQDLDSAQLRKLDYHIRESRAAKTENVLDVGCGWGSTLKRLIDRHGVKRAVGLTLSQAQADWVTASLDKASPIEIRVEDWRDHVPEAPYDAIISIGAFEHFARTGITVDEKIEVYRSFFRRCHEWLRPGGRLSLQSIEYGNLRQSDMSKFIELEIFPESDLPRLSEIASAADGVLEVVKVRNDRKHYERTGLAWLAHLKANRAEMIGRFGQEVVDRYIKYINLIIVGFHVGSMNLLRITFQRYDLPSNL